MSSKERVYVADDVLIYDIYRYIDIKVFWGMNLVALV